MHLLDAPDGGPAALRRRAAVGLPAPLLEVHDWLDLERRPAAARGAARAAAEAVVVEDLSTHPAPERYRRAGPRRASAASGPRR